MVRLIFRPKSKNVARILHFFVATIPSVSQPERLQPR